MMNDMSVERLNHPGIYTSNHGMSSAGGLQFGKSVIGSQHDLPGSSLHTVERVVSSFPQPKKSAFSAKPKPKDTNIEGGAAAGSQLAGID